jgi:hypothetical protein
VATSLENKKARKSRAFIVEPAFVRQRLPPVFCDFANVAETEPEPAGGFGAAAFFGLRISRFECFWPLAMG